MLRCSVYGEYIWCNPINRWSWLVLMIWWSPFQCLMLNARPFKDPMCALSANSFYKWRYCVDVRWIDRSSNIFMALYIYRLSGIIDIYIYNSSTREQQITTHETTKYLNSRRTKIITRHTQNTDVLYIHSSGSGCDRMRSTSVDNNRYLIRTAPQTRPRCRVKRPRAAQLSSRARRGSRFASRDRELVSRDHCWTHARSIVVEARRDEVAFYRVECASIWRSREQRNHIQVVLGRSRGGPRSIGEIARLRPAQSRTEMRRDARGLFACKLGECVWWIGDWTPLRPLRAAHHRRVHKIYYIHNASNANIYMWIGKIRHASRPLVDSLYKYVLALLKVICAPTNTGI